MNKHPHPRGTFHALTVGLQTIRALRPVVARIERRDRKLAQQIRDAASSITANLGEGNWRQGKDRPYHFSVAAGSANEVRVHLLTAEAWGHVEMTELGDALELLDRELAMLWRLTH
jgi:four helix bundle protein